MAKKINLIFTRDFSLCVSDFWHTMLSQDAKRVFGIGINKQIIRFNSRAVEAYRVYDEMEKVKNKIISKRKNDLLFSKKTERIFKKNISKTVAFLKKQKILNLKKSTGEFEISVILFRSIYPYIMLSNFLPGPWKNNFLKKHPYGNTIINRWYQARVYSEGKFELIDTYWRILIGKLLEKNKLHNKFSNVVRFNELKIMLAGGKPPSQKELQKRLTGYILYQGILMTGKKFSEFLKENNFKCEDQLKIDSSQLKGQVANRGGVITGIVQNILNGRELKSFKKGHILVTSMTTPDFVPAMQKSSAIITDEGGLTCHAAIVSRELNIPCVIGTKIATKVLKDGDRVEVDANKGIVRKLK